MLYICICYCKSHNLFDPFISWLHVFWWLTGRKYLHGLGTSPFFSVYLEIFSSVFDVPYFGRILLWGVFNFFQYFALQLFPSVNLRNLYQSQKNIKIITEMWIYSPFLLRIFLFIIFAFTLRVVVYLKWILWLVCKLEVKCVFQQSLC